MTTCSFCGGNVSEAVEKTSMRLFGKVVCTRADCEKKANAEAAKATEQFTPEYLNIEMGDLLEKAGWKVKGWSACKDLGADNIEVRVDFKILPLQVFTRMGAMPWTELAENPELRHPKVHELLLRVQDMAKQATRKNRAAKKETPVPESKDVMESKYNEAKKERLPAHQGNPMSPEKPLTDAERDALIETAKARRWLSDRGSSYKVQGKERPDSHQIQKIANERGISLEILSTIQTESFAEVKVRAHLGEIYCDAVVHHEFKDEFLLKTMEVLYKNPDILDHWEGQEPVIKEGAKITVREDGREITKDAKYFIIHSLLTWKKFAMRDARTKAAAIAEAMLLNQDFREPEEKRSEQDEAALVQESIKNRKEVMK